MLSWSGGLPRIYQEQLPTDCCLIIADLFQGIAEWCANGEWQLADTNSERANTLREYFKGMRHAADHLQQALEVE